MDFLEWLADELRKTKDEEIEIGFDKDTNLDELGATEE